MALDEDIRVLSRLPYFSELDPVALRLVAFSAEARTLAAHEVLFERDEISDGGYVVLSGSVALGGGEGEPLHVVERERLIGARALFAETTRTVRAVAREPTRVLRIPRSLLRRVLQEFPGSAARLRQVVGGQARELVSELVRLKTEVLDAPDDLSPRSPNEKSHPHDPETPNGFSDDLRR